MDCWCSWRYHLQVDVFSSVDSCRRFNLFADGDGVRALRSGCFPSQARKVSPKLQADNHRNLVQRHLSYHPDAHCTILDVLRLRFGLERCTHKSVKRTDSLGNYRVLIPLSYSFTGYRILVFCCLLPALGSKTARKSQHAKLDTLPHQKSTRDQNSHHHRHSVCIVLASNARFSFQVQVFHRKSLANFDVSLFLGRSLPQRNQSLALHHSQQHVSSSILSHGWSRWSNISLPNQELLRRSQ